MAFVLLWLAALLTQTPARPTSEHDPMPAASLDYFAGTWSFEWNLPDSPLGPGGKIEGRETFRKLEPPIALGKMAGFPDLPASAMPAPGTTSSLYESVTEATGPDGPIRIRALMSLDAAKKTVTRVEVDSRGFTTTKTGPIGGDLGGYYSIFWESTPIAIKGQTVKLRGRTIMYSPVSYRIEYKMSVDAGRLMDFGRPWFKKQ